MFYKSISHQTYYLKVWGTFSDRNIWEEFEDTKEVIIRIRKSEGRQLNDQRKGNKDKQQSAKHYTEN